jgi:polyhydroxyalkanoate synthesis regulator phasin
MVESAPDGFRFDAVSKLYSIIQHADPGSEKALIAEHAIDLALNPGRDVDPAYFLRNVWRDARRVTRRQRSAHPVESWDALAGDLASGTRAADSTIRLSLVQFTDNNTPEAQAIANQIEQRLRVTVSSIDANALRCLEGMLDGESVEQTARAAAIPNRRVKRLRQRIRAAARKITERKSR